MWLRHWTLKRKIEKLEELNNVKNFHLKHVEMQNKELIDLVQSYFQANAKNKKKILKTLQDITPAVIAQRAVNEKHMLLVLKEHKDFVKHLLKNKFLSQQFKENLQEFGLTQASVSDKITIEPAAYQVIVQGLGSLFNELLEHGKITIKSLKSKKNALWKEEHAEIVRDYLEREAVLIQAVKQALTELCQKLRNRAEAQNIPVAEKRFYQILSSDATYGDLKLSGLWSTSPNIVAGYLAYECSKLTAPKKDKLAIMITGSHDEMAKCGPYFCAMYVHRIQLAMGFKASEIVMHPSHTEFKTILEDDSIQHIAILGRGSSHEWHLHSGEIITNMDFTNAQGQPVQKSGYLLKHTCTPETSYSMLHSAVKAAELMKYLITPKEFQSLWFGDCSFAEGKVANWEHVKSVAQFVDAPCSMIQLPDAFAKNKS